MLAEMRWILVHLLLVVASLEALPRPGQNEDRIADGVDSSPGAFPFLPSVHILSNAQIAIGLGICSSTVISKRHILTAGHCIVTADENAPVVYSLAYLIDFGEYFTKFVDNNKTFIVPMGEFGYSSRVIIHPSFSIINFGHDIAIIEFPEGTDFGIEPITLAKDYVVKDGDEALAAGYGLTSLKFELGKDGKKVPKKTPAVRLRNTTVSVYTEETCKKRHAVNSGAYRLTHGLICMGKKTQTVLFGDSGGPLMIERKGKKYQIGITSFMFPDTDSFDNFYTPVSLYCDFIAKATKGEAKCESLPKEPQPSPKPGQPEDSGGAKPGQAEGLAASAVIMNNLSVVFTILMCLLQFF